MKFVDAVRHLKSVGLVTVMPDGKPHPLSRSLRNPRGFVPVRILKKGQESNRLLERIRQSRAELRNGSK